MIEGKDVRTQLIKRIKEHGSPKKIEQLCLDEISITYFTAPITAILQACHRVQHLSLCDCQLNSLADFPSLPQLQILELAHNKQTVELIRIQGEHLETLSKTNSLSSLTLDYNRIADFAWVRFFKRTKIVSLSLKQNPITEIYSQKQYREKIYRAFGNDLQYLDGSDRQGNQAQEQESSDSGPQASQNISKQQGNDSSEESFRSDNEASLKLEQDFPEAEEEKKTEKKLKRQDSVYPVEEPPSNV